MTRWGFLAAVPVALGLAGCGGASAPASTPAPASVSSSASASAPPAAGKPAAAASSKPAGAKFTMAASQTSLSNVVLWLGKQEGMFSKHGLELDLTGANASVASKMLIAGQIDATLIGGPEAVTARAAGAPLKVVAVLVPVYNHDFVTPASVTSLDQLKGKNVGVSMVASLNGAGTIGGLRLYGLEPQKDYKLMETGSNGAQQALAAQLIGHNIDAAAFDPTPARLTGNNPGLHALVDPRVRNLPLASASFTFQESFIQQHPDSVEKAVEAFMDTVTFAASHKAETEQVLKRDFKVEDSALEENYQDLISVWAKVPAPANDQFTPIVDALAPSAPQLKDVDLNKLLDPTFVQKAAADMKPASK